MAFAYTLTVLPVLGGSVILHKKTHPTLDVEGCFGCKVSSVQVSPAATPSRSPGAAAINRKESGWERDMPAYRRLRSQGYQPQGIDGCGDLESRAETREEIEMGHVFPKDRLPAIKEDLAKARDMGLLTATGEK